MRVSRAFADPLLLGAPIDVALGLEDVRAAAAEAEDRPAHRFDRDIAGEDEQVGPADALAVFLLDRPQQAPRLVEVAVVRPAVERGEALLPAIGAAAPVGGAIGARGVPRHADHERAVVPVIGRPPRLAVGHQRGQVALQRLIVELLEGLGIVEVLAHRDRATRRPGEGCRSAAIPATSRGWCGRAASAPSSAGPPGSHPYHRSSRP